MKFLEYVALPQEESERTFDDPYVTRLQQTIQRIKRSREMGKRYMTLQEYFREDLIEAKEEGIAIGRSEGEEHKLLALIQKKLAKGKSVEQIADEVEETIERVMELIEKLG